MPTRPSRSGAAGSGLAAVFLAWTLALLPAPGAAQSIVGVVVDAADGTRLVGARVLLLGPDEQILEAVRSDAEGRFRLDTGGPGDFWVTAEAAGYAAALSDRLPVEGEGLVDHPVRLVPLGGDVETVAVLEAVDLARACRRERGGSRGAIVVGQVRDPGGETLTGVWVSAEWAGGGGPARREGRSGVDGLFVFCDVPAGAPVTLRAAHTDRVGPGTRVTLHEQAVHRIDVTLPRTTADRPGRLLGRVVDVGTGTGVAAAELAVLGTRVRLWTDSHGHFAMDSVPPGLHTLRVAGLGYATREIDVVVAPDGSHGVQIPMSRGAVELDPVVVTVRSPRWYGDMRGFQQRMLVAAGAFLTRQDISRLQPTRLLDVLREVPGVTVVERRDQPPAIRMRGRRCDPDLVVDRVPRRDRELLTELRGVDLEAVEVYRSAAENPGLYARPGACGAILVWTRRAVV